MKICLINAAIEQAELIGSIFIFSSLPYITDIRSFNQSGKELKVDKNLEKYRITYKCDLSLGKNRVKFFYKIPAKQYYDNFLREKSMLFFNSKP